MKQLLNPKGTLKSTKKGAEKRMPPKALEKEQKRAQNDAKMEPKGNNKWVRFGIFFWDARGRRKGTQNDQTRTKMEPKEGFNVRSMLNFQHIFDF